MYEFQANVCNGTLRLRYDNVYISNRLGSTQSTISALLNERIQRVQAIIAKHDKDCVEQVYRVICQYYLPSCGNFTHLLPPTSLCQEECVHVQGNCGATWQAAEIVFIDPTFIDCDDTSQLLFPLPNCCTGAGIKLPTESTLLTSILASGPSPVFSTIATATASPTISSGGAYGGGAYGGGDIGGGAVAGIVIGILIVIVAVGSIAAFIIKYVRKDRIKQMERVQLDIMSKYVLNV